MFLLFTGADATATPVPGTGYTFSVLKQAQALGDFDALAAADREVVHYHFDDPTIDPAEAFERVALDIPVGCRCAEASGLDCRDCGRGRSPSPRNPAKWPGCFRRRISACSKALTAISGSSPNGSWMRSASPTDRAWPMSAPAAAGSRSVSRAASVRTARVYAQDIQPQMIDVDSAASARAKD